MKVETVREGEGDQQRGEEREERWLGVERIKACHGHVQMSHD